MNTTTSARTAKSHRHVSVQVSTPAAAMAQVRRHLGRGWYVVSAVDTGRTIYQRPDLPIYRVHVHHTGRRCTECAK